MPYKIRIGGLSVTAASSLEVLFSPFGPVAAVEVLDEDASGGLVGVVTFEDEAGAERAVADMDGATVDGATITVEPLDLRPPPPRLPPDPPAPT